MFSKGTSQQHSRRGSQWPTRSWVLRLWLPRPPLCASRRTSSWTSVSPPSRWRTRRWRRRRCRWGGARRRWRWPRSCWALHPPPRPSWRRCRDKLLLAAWRQLWIRKTMWAVKRNSILRQCTYFLSTVSCSEVSWHSDTWVLLLCTIVPFW